MRVFVLSLTHPSNEYDGRPLVSDLHVVKSFLQEAWDLGQEGGGGGESLLAC